MNSIRKWFYRPRRDDTSLMAQFYYADEELNLVSGELDSFDGRKDPERCTALVNQLRQAQDKVLNICVEMMEDLLPEERAPRDFRVKFPDDVMQETLFGQLLFGAECLAAGSSILNRESESTKMRPLAKAVTKTIVNVRNLIREQCLKPIPEYTEKIRESLKIFDRLFADFELSYVSAMVPVKSVEEYEMQQNVIVLFSDTLQRSVKIGLVVQEQIDNYDPALMFTIPRLAIVAGLVIFPEGPLNVEKESKNMSELFRPFKTLLLKIRELLWTMSPQELATLEKCLCSMEEPDISIQSYQKECPLPPSLYQGPVAYTSDFVHRFYTSYPSCRQLTPDMISFCSSKKMDRNERKRDRNSSKSSRTRARQERQSERFLSRLTGVEERPRAKRRSRRGYVQQPNYHHYQDNCPEVCSTVDSENSSHFDPMIRQPPPLHPRISPGRPVQHSQYTSNDDRLHSNFSGRRRSQHYCPSWHSGTDRINTIVCACGTTNGHIPSNTERITASLSTDENYQQVEEQSRYTNNDSSYLNSNACTVYRNPDHLETGSEYAGNHSYYIQDFDSSRDISTSVHVESIPVSVELNRAANIQHCVANAVIADPCILFPVTLQEEDGTLERNLSPHLESNYLSSDFDNLNLTEESRPPVRINCDDCNTIQNYSCDTSTVTSYNTQVDQIVNNTCDTGKENSADKVCMCVSKSIEKDDGLIANVSLGTSPPIPEPRHSHTSLRPYGTKIPIPIHSTEDSKQVEQKRISKSQGPSHEIQQSSYNIDKHCEDIDADIGSSGSTSPHHSGTEDDEEVALAMQAAEVAASWKVRERFADSGDLIQRLFVCISGVADQLQTNYASDLRKILRCVFTMNQTPEEEEVEVVEGKEHILTQKESGNEDGTSTSGSEQLSVESAEDALAAIGNPEAEEQPTTLEGSSDGEEDKERNSLLSDDSRPRSLLRANSVLVPPSVFNDHSLMQYSTMSPPPPVINHNYSATIESGEIFSDVDTLVNDDSFSEMSVGLRNRQDSSQSPNMLLFNLNTISENLGSIPTIAPVSTLISVAAASPPGSAAVVADTPSSTQSQTQSSDPQENQIRRYSIVQEPPLWIPDNLAPRCMACGALFTVVRRRHHCRNCGKVFCGHCSRHSVPLPHFGIWKNVRVCNACFLYYVTSSADGSSALS